MKKGRPSDLGGLWRHGLLVELPLCAVVLVVIDGARGAVQPAIERDAVCTGKAAVILKAHVAFFAVDADFAAFKVAGFVCRELAASYALANALLLEITALVNGGSMARRKVRSRGRSSLTKANG
jgi:hypothetical protein